MAVEPTPLVYSIPMLIYIVTGHLGEGVLTD